ncbi:hypothetical protein C7999DRAFT_36620, partial [Corynascus novoguineensis]
MDVLTYYSIGFSAMWVVPLLPGLYALFCRHVVPLFRRQLAKVRYQRIGGLTRLHLFRGATCVELLLLSAYIAGNGVAVALKAIKGATIASSAALAASINLIPLLLGGRTSRVADVIGVSRPTYYVAHYWIGRTAIVEGLVYAAIGLNSVARGQTFDPIAVSGCITAGSFLAVFLLSLPRLRRMLGAAFHGVHRILYLAGMTGLVWHVLLTRSVLHEVLVFVACGLWLLSHVYRVVTRWRSAEVTEKWSDSETVSGKTTDFHILAGRQSRYLRQLRTIEKGDRMLLDGLYGQDLQLYKYETVILTAKGM